MTSMAKIIIAGEWLIASRVQRYRCNEVVIVTNVTNLEFNICA